MGQLKAMEQLLRARLTELNLTIPPLNTTTTDDDDNHALTNLRQTKTMFNFTIEDENTDDNGMMDAWELEHFDTLKHDLNLNTDSDGMSDHDEWLTNTDPND
jgi:hypothetical protein